MKDVTVLDNDEDSGAHHKKPPGFSGRQGLIGADGIVDWGIIENGQHYLANCPDAPVRRQRQPLPRFTDVLDG